MRHRKVICIIHPEGNFQFNPSLRTIVEFITERGDKVDIWSFTRDISQKTSNRRARQHFINTRIGHEVFTSSRHRRLNAILTRIIYWLYTRSRPDVIIGCDSQGIILAETLSRRLGSVPIGMLSYELLFAEEVGESVKAAERVAAKCLKFAIAPGKFRAMELAKENWISPERIFSIPVSPAHPLPYEKSRYLHKTLGLSDTTKIALYAGSLSPWACISPIIQSVTSWPKDWVLVLHSRYKSELESFLSDASGSETSNRIYFSKQTEVSLEKMDEILFSATIGLAFYSPTFQDPTSGLNLRTIDLSSGKISTYLQHSLPVITNAEGEIKDLISEYRAGAWVLNPSKIGSALESITTHEHEKMTAGSRKLFSDVLCGQNYRSLLISLIDSATDSKDDGE